MASWRAPGSILEVPGLDFGASGPRFWPLSKSSGIDFSAEGWQESVSYQQVRFSWFRRFGVRFLKLNMPKKPRTPSSKVWTNCSQNVGFHFPMCLQQCSPADASLKCMAVPQHSCTQMGRRRWPPPGGVQSAAHRRCAKRARSLSKNAMLLPQLAKLQRP